MHIIKMLYRSIDNIVTFAYLEERIMATEIFVCLDLGNDTLKISFAYENENEEAYGKLNIPDLLNQVAYPAAAFYDTEAKQWLFAEELESGDNKNFSTVVKIKEMLSLIVRHENKTIEARNREYYREGHYFPQFSFPVRHKIGRDFQYLVDNKLVFEVPTHTPQSMCEAFFMHMKDQIMERINAFSEISGIEFEPLTKITVVHPPKLGTDYSEELYRLIRTAFGFDPIKDITSTQALGLFAFHNGLLNKNDRLLIFDMGDETISVAKVWCNEVEKTLGDHKMGILVDSPSGHLVPLEVGGSNIDEAVNEYLEKAIYNRETVGSPSADKIGHIFENGLCANQYLLMKDIKKAKMLMHITGNGMFKDGVPISIRRETLIQKMLTPADFSECVGTTIGLGIAQKILQYIRQEIRLPGNRDVTKMLFAGGMVETFGLMDFIKQEISKQYPSIQIITFDNDVRDNHPFHIQFFETSTYAASVGGAVVALKDYSVDAVLSFSYGTWLYHENQYNQYKKHLKLFANRGALLLEDQNRFALEATINISPKELYVLEGDEMFSTVINSEEIAQHRYANQVTYDQNWLVIGEAGDYDRKRAEQAIDLRVVAGGRSTEIQFYHRNTQVALSGYDGQVVYFEEGFVVDKNGVAKLFFSNLKEKNHMRITVKYLNTGKSASVLASELEFRLTMKSIEVATNN